MDFKHVIVSRVNIPRNLDPSNHRLPAPWEKVEWNERRVELLNGFTRSSLLRQTEKDFEFVTLWGPQHPADKEKALPNERQVLIERGVNELDEKPFDFVQWREDDTKLEKTEMDFAFQIRDKLRQIYEPPVLFTNLDSDDCLRYDFVENVQCHAYRLLEEGRHPAIIDFKTRFGYHVESGGMGKKVRNSPSPASSSLETKSIECYPLRWHHSMMRDYLPEDVEFEFVDDLFLMQTITNSNILTQGTGDDGAFNPGDYF